VATLLLRLGIVARVRSTQQSSGNPVWSVDVSGAVDQRWFLRKVGAFGPRVDPAVRLTGALEGVVPNTNVDTLPTQVFERMKAVMEWKGFSQAELALARGVASSGRSSFEFSPSRWLVAQYAEILDDDILRQAATSDAFWDRVTLVSSLGAHPVYDLTVPGPSSWLAGAGVVFSHNSGAIEQDSDIVMFIHRDDADQEHKREAELIIAKHRNGPTGKVGLNFEPSLTQFRNAARTQQPE
jgi:replicative DNA helicase